MSETEPAADAVSKTAAERLLPEAEQRLVAALNDAAVLVERATARLDASNAEMDRREAALNRAYQRLAEKVQLEEAQMQWIVRPWSLAAVLFGLLGGLLGAMLGAVMRSLW